MSRDKLYWWAESKKASAIIGWFPTVILAQWQWETGNFSSANFLNNNNIAGQTWREYMPEFMKGTARPKAEGGYYIKYEDAVDGYVDFIQKNKRYSHVCNEKTEEAQIRAIAAAGWAVDPNYANGLIKTLNGNKLQGYVIEIKEDEDIMNRTEYEWSMIRKFVGDAYNDGILTDWKWVQMVDDKTMTAGDLSFITFVVVSRRAGINLG